MDIRKIKTPIGLREYWAAFSESISGKSLESHPLSFLALHHLMENYNRSGREYHNTKHIEFCLHELHSKALKYVTHLNEIIFAIIFHDSVQEINSKLNEFHSARVAYTNLDALDWKDKINPVTVHDFIMVTDHSREPKTTDEKIIVDIDLAILGQDESAYLKYEEAIRKEYSWVNDTDFKDGRIKVLQKFLDRRGGIFYTDVFQCSYEGLARRNMERAIERLQS
jgi:predicted metal-dependent HD superfamily phosphohydrolase